MPRRRRPGGWWSYSLRPLTRPVSELLVDGSGTHAQHPSGAAGCTTEVGPRPATQVGIKRVVQRDGHDERRGEGRQVARAYGVGRVQEDHVQVLIESGVGEGVKPVVDAVGDGCHEDGHAEGTADTGPQGELGFAHVSFPFGRR